MKGDDGVNGKENIQYFDKNKLIKGKNGKAGLQGDLGK